MTRAAARRKEIVAGAALRYEALHAFPSEPLVVEKKGVRPLKDIKLMKEDPEGIEKSADDIKKRYAAIFKV